MTRAILKTLWPELAVCLAVLVGVSLMPVLEPVSLRLPDDPVLEIADVPPLPPEVDVGAPDFVWEPETQYDPLRVSNIDTVDGASVAQGSWTYARQVHLKARFCVDGVASTTAGGTSRPEVFFVGHDRGYREGELLPGTEVEIVDVYLDTHGSGAWVRWPDGDMNLLELAPPTRR